MTIELFSDHYDVSQFESGAEELDRWLKEHALTAQTRDTARVCVIEGAQRRVIGYSAVVVGTVSRVELSSRARSGLPSYIPCVLLGKLAVDRDAASKGHARELFMHAVRLAIQLNERAAVRLLVAEARDGTARDWYVRQGMACLPDGRTCYLRLADLK